MQSNIPSIDFSSFLHGSVNDQQRVALEIDRALTSVGFIRLYNHDIQQHKIDECFQWSKRLFECTEWKDDMLNDDGGTDRSLSHGYSAVGLEKIRGHMSMKESFSCGNPDDAERPTKWPKEELLPGFRHFAEDFFQDCQKLTRQLLECLSLALNLPAEQKFENAHARALFSMDFIHYPAIGAEVLQRSRQAIRMPAHSDFGTVTLLFQDEVGGLEIADSSSTTSSASAAVEKSGRFLHVDPTPGSVIVNIGYLLMRWTNGRWKNTVHRVSAPPTLAPPCHLGEKNSHDLALVKCYDMKHTANLEAIPARYSIGYFTVPDPDTVITALPCCCQEEAPKKPINVGEYLRRKRTTMYSGSD